MINLVLADRVLLDWDNGRRGGVSPARCPPVENSMVEAKGIRSVFRADSKSHRTLLSNTGSSAGLQC